MSLGRDFFANQPTVILPNAPKQDYSQPKQKSLTQNELSSYRIRSKGGRRI